MNHTSHTWDGYSLSSAFSHHLFSHTHHTLYAMPRPLSRASGISFANNTQGAFIGEWLQGAFTTKRSFPAFISLGKKYIIHLIFQRGRLLVCAQRLCVCVRFSKGEMCFIKLIYYDNQSVRDDWWDDWTEVDKALAFVCLEKTNGSWEKSVRTKGSKRNYTWCASFKRGLVLNSFTCQFFLCMDFCVCVAAWIKSFDVAWPCLCLHWNPLLLSE
jgi:hypothetical protein